MRDCYGAFGRRVAASPGGRPVAGGSWPDGQASPPSSQSVTHRPSVDRSGGHHVQAHPHPHHRGHTDRDAPGRHDRRRLGPSQRPARPAAAHPRPGWGVLAPASGHSRAAHHRQRRPATAHRKPSRRVLALPDRRPSAAGRTGWSVELGRGFARAAGRRPGAGWWAGRAGCQAGWPEGSGRARGLTRNHGHAARWGGRAHPAAPSPTRSPDPGHRAIGCVRDLSQPTIDLCEQEEQ